MNYVSYLRVSTTKQGVVGLGIEAQRAAVAAYVAGRGEILAELVEVESGGRNDRPQLSAALALAKRRRATLVIAKLDRLARNVHFISGLMDSGVEFVAVDFPQANRLTLHILAAVAEHERDMISARTKAALAVAKARGVRLGNPRLAGNRDAAAAGKRAAAGRFAGRVVPLIKSMRAAGAGWSAIALDLNQRGLKTARGRDWSSDTVRDMTRDRIRR